MISIHPYGDCALLVNFEPKIDRNIHEQVLALQHALTGTRGIQYLIPAYCSLTVVFDLRVTNASVLQDLIVQCTSNTGPLASGTQHPVSSTQHRVHEIPVCYDGDYAPDLKEVSEQTRKSVEEIISTHLGTEFYVYMLGFVPGFAYMGDMPEEYYCHRHKTPRTHVPPGSVGLAGRQTAIYPFESPGGWQIIGRTPIKMFDAMKTQAARLSAGDMVRFVRVSEEEYSSMA